MLKPAILALIRQVLTVAGTALVGQRVCSGIRGRAADRRDAYHRLGNLVRSRQARPVTALRFLSVCSGIEAASVAWAPLGWQASAVAEIDPFACPVPHPASSVHARPIGSRSRGSALRRSKR